MASPDGTEGADNSEKARRVKGRRSDQASPTPWPFKEVRPEADRAPAAAGSARLARTMTERLYLVDPYLFRFEAEVLAARELSGRRAVVLDRTAFYPEGGGQPADRGSIGDAAVVDVREVDGELLHVLDGGAAAPRGRVTAQVDRARRLDHMQQHHGQHLLSAAFERGQAARTVSFHLGEELCTIDLDAPADRLGIERLRAAEALANEWILADLPVEARELSPEELARLPLRKEPTKGARVVLVGRAEELIDASPCGGTHPRRTGEVGAMAVLRAQKWGAGTRIEFIAGSRVVAALAQANDRLARAAGALRCAPAELPEAVARLADAAARHRKELEKLAGELAGAEAVRLAGLAAGAVVGELTPPAGPAAAWIKAVGQALAAQGRVAVLGAREEGRAYLLFARPRGAGTSAGEALRSAVAVVGGKGGGSPELAQGSGPDAERLPEALALGAKALAG
jgi:alanyl-tRNA synthetase